MSDTEPMSDAPAEGAESTPGSELVGQVLAGRYRVERLLGAGGMGAVYRAEHVHMRKAVALKVLHREMTAQPEVVARFEREAVAAARIEHPNVALATDFGRLENGSFYLVLEYVEGKSLNKLLKEQRTLAPERVLRIARQITSALRAAHEAGIVHRDLKPDNVMLVEREGDPDFVKVLDFGIAKVNVEDSSEQLTRMGTIFGTPEYMAPEQAQGATVDARADLYTVGILMYEMLAGTTPFKHDDLIVVLTRQLTEEPPKLPPTVDRPINELVMKLLAKLPDERVQTAEELVQRIDALLGAVTPGPMSVGAVPRAEGPPSAPLSVAAMSERASAIALTARQALDRAVQEKPWTPLVERRVRVAGRMLPLWALALAVTALLVVGSVIVGRSGDAAEPADSRLAPVPARERNLDAELREQIAKARAGDRAALAELQKRPEGRRGAAEWLAIAQGLTSTRQYTAAIHAYAGAVRKDPSLGKDPGLLGDVRYAAELGESSDEALRFAADALDAAGADLLYDVWATFRRDKDKQAVAERAKALLDSPAVQRRATPALSVALDLHAAKGCPAYKKLMPRAIEHADERSVALLRPLNQGRGCGFLGLADCYACLRGPGLLADALRSAQGRPAPTFARETRREEGPGR